ncbi:hypothetical protein JHK87_010215 [Glycine soja]|nr:hypothetical protein JHK87_010215 [Glycine soja]
MNFSVNNCYASIEILNGLNYPKGKDDLEFSLGISDLDLALCERERYQVYDNVESGCLMKQLMDMRYDNVGGVREFIMKMVNIRTKLKSHKIDFNKKFIVEHALNCLFADFTQIKIAYNTIGQKWTMNDLITKCVAEEEKLKKEKSDIALLSVHSKPTSGKGHWKNTKSTSNASHKYQDYGKPGKVSNKM